MLADLQLLALAQCEARFYFSTMTVQRDIKGLSLYNVTTVDELDEIPLKLLLERNQLVRKRLRSPVTPVKE